MVKQAALAMPSQPFKPSESAASSLVLYTSIRLWARHCMSIVMKFALMDCAASQGIVL